MRLTIYLGLMLIWAMICLCATTYRARWICAILLIIVGLIVNFVFFGFQVFSGIAASAGDGNGSNVPDNPLLIISTLGAFFLIFAIAPFLKQNPQLLVLLITAYALLWIGLWIGFKDFPNPTGSSQIWNVGGHLQVVHTPVKGLAAFRVNTRIAGIVTLFSTPIWAALTWRNHGKSGEKEPI
ncbi:MAG TPA: hypothetical protein VK737_13395 [Opitutales bacterium]|nr:hypothetical protein [Opitutales bacterium]